MPPNARAAHSRQARQAARDLARTPIVDPYRGQLHVPPAVDNRQLTNVARNMTASESVTSSVSAPRGCGPLQAPSAATAAGTLAIILGLFAALFGLGLLTILILAHTLTDVPDRSFYQGSDAASAVLGLGDIALCGLGVFGGLALNAGRLIGRIAVTVFGWVMLGMSVYWVHDGRAVIAVPLLAGAVSIAILLLSYHPSVSRWLGVLAPPQPR